MQTGTNQKSKHHVHSQTKGSYKEDTNFNMYKKLKPPVFSREFGKENQNSNDSNFLTNNLRKQGGDSKNIMTKKVVGDGRLNLNLNLNFRPRTIRNSINETYIPKTHSVNTSLCNNENYNHLNIPSILRDKLDADRGNLNTTTIQPTISQVQTKYTSTPEIIFKSSSHKKTFDSNKFPIITLSGKNNPQVVPEYLEEIYDYLKDVEKSKQPNYEYMKTQPDINEKKRAILIDWLVDVHLKFKLTAETLFLTVNIIDRFLEKIQIQKSKLRLLGVSSLFIACKYEEICPPKLKDFVNITAKAYTKEEILEMESNVLGCLGFSITFPSSLRFLEIYIELSQLKNEDHLVLFARYLLELILVEYRMLKYPPSWVAGSSLYMSMKIKKLTTNKKFDISKLCGYTEEKLIECGKDICLILDNADKNQNILKAVKNKFSGDNFLNVANGKK